MNETRGDKRTAEGAGPPDAEEVVRDFLARNYHRLVHHARRHIHHDEMAGDVPEGALDPRDVVDEVVRQVEANLNRKPQRMHWLVWTYHLLHEELQRQREYWKEKQAKEISTEQARTPPELSRRALHPMEKMVVKTLEPEVIRIEDLVPNPEAVPPDRVVEIMDQVENLQEAIQSWPRPEREAFELYFVEGFEVDDITAIAGQPLEKVRERIAAIERRLPRRTAA